MKAFVGLFTTLLVCLVLLSDLAKADWSPINYRDSITCGKKNRMVVSAVSRACQIEWVVPSKKAGNGVYSKDDTISIYFNGKCRPKERISKKQCHDQLYNMCVNGRKNGTGRARYGRNGCQSWHIRKMR